MKGRIFNIQRFSIHDGPGIRTTVFMKGCNLRCRWCHNPESRDMHNQIMFFAHKCKSCGACKDLCDKMFTPDCINCGKCAKACLYQARELCGQEITADELMEQIKKDSVFYQTSGGGVTFSGGEPLLQMDFLKETAQMCRKEGIHTAIETAGNVSEKVFEEAINAVDMIIYDIKCMDESLHIQGTGMSNRQILKNASTLMKSDKDFLLRMPLIPGFNENEADKVAKFARGNKLELMPYHAIGSGKYSALGLKYDDKEFTVPQKEFMEKIKQKYPNVFFE